MSYRLACSALALSFALLAAPARAQSGDTARAEALFREGRKAAEAHDYGTAKARFTESLKLGAVTGTILNLADCEEHLGDLASAFQHYAEVLLALKPGDDRTVFVKGRIAALEPRLPRLTIRLAPGAPEGTVVRRDGEEVLRATLGAAMLVNPGAHTVVAEAPGRAPGRFTVTTGEASTSEIEVAPGPAASADRAESHGTAGSGRLLGFVIGGAGAASLLVSAVTGGLTIAKKNAVEKACHDRPASCPRAGFADAQEAARSGKALSIASTVTFSVGLAAVGVGVWRILATRNDLPPVSVAVFPGGGAVELVGRF